MTEKDDRRFDLSRRTVLGSLGALGVGATLGGAGTAAFYSDEETLENTELVAGEFDLKVDWQEAYNGEMIDAHPDRDGDGVQDRYTRQEITADPTVVGLPADATDEAIAAAYRAQFADVPDDLAGRPPVIDLDDVKPGDSGEVTFSVHLFDNPGYLWMNGALRGASENGINEPEGEDSDEVAGVVELLDAIRTSIWYDADCDNAPDEGEMVIFEDVALRDALTYLDANDGIGIPLDGSRSTVEIANNPVVDPGTAPETTYDSLHQTGEAVTVDGEQRTIGQNPKCADFGLVEVVKIGDGEPGGPLPGDGNAALYPTPYGDLRVTQDGQTIQWQTDASPDDAFAADENGFAVSKVIVKGGSQGGNVYSYDNDDGDANFDDDVDPERSSGETAAWLQTPSGQDISHVSFCIDAVPSDDEGDGENGRECFPNSTTQCLGFEWWLPVDHANEIQTDSVAFDLGFYAEQCRHNDGTGMAGNVSSE